MPVSVVKTGANPGDDFDAYVNGVWRSKTQIPAERGAITVSDEVDDNMFNDIHNIVQRAVVQLRSKSASKTPKHGTPMTAEQLVATFYVSGTVSRLQYRGVDTMLRLLRRIDCVRDKDDVIKTAVEHMRTGIMAAFQIVVSPDEHDTRIARLHLNEGDVPIQNLEVYSRPGSALHTQYRAYLKRVGTRLEVPTLANVVNIEATIARAMQSDDDSGHPDRSYNRFTPRELEEHYPHIPWATLWRALKLGGLDQPPVPEFVIMPAAHYYAALDRMFRTMNIEEWQLLLKAFVIHSLVRFLPPPFDEDHYRFFGRAIHGDTRKAPQERLVLDAIRQGIPDSIGALFIDAMGKDVAKSIRNGVTTMFNAIRHTMANRIAANTWMNDSTRATAMSKIEAMVGKIAFPARWQTYGGLKLDSRTFVDNILACNAWAWDRDWKHLEQLVDRTMWFNGAVEVNAYYYPEENAIVMPIGILRPPFYNPTASLAWNMGGVGCVIGHEICHGFDNEGKEYDASGNLSKWWTTDDLHQFTIHANQLEHALSNTIHAGEHVDGRQTLAEAIADLTGMRVALDTLMSSLNPDTATYATDRINALREFFISYAVSWRKKERDRYARDTLATDVHPPARVRVNLIVAQIAEWYEAFDVGADAALYREPNERIPTVI